MRRWHAMRPISITLLACFAACDRRDPPASDTATDTTVAETDRPVPLPWVSELGPLFVVPSDSEGTGVVVFPQTLTSAQIARSPITLLSASGDSVQSQASLVPGDAQACDDAPSIRVRVDSTHVWSVGLVLRSAVALPMDSMESLSPADSARIAVDLARLASALPSPGESRFSGIPFVVLTSRLLRVSGTEAVVAELVRRVPQEASPLQEHTLIVADRTTPTEVYRLAYHRRSEGTEETVDHHEVLAAIRSGETTFLLLARDREGQIMYEILERSGAGKWRVRWERTLAC